MPPGRSGRGARSPLNPPSFFCAAILVGAWLRFEHLDSVDMTAGEGVEWIAAAAPNIYGVLHLALPLNPGKLGLYDVMMHLWMEVFGDSLAALRALSAALGALSILLTFMVVLELLAPAVGDARKRQETDRDWIAATAALLVAFNVPLIHHSREARMYMVLVPVVLAQVWFFLRANRAGGWFNYAGVTAFSALGIAANFTAGSVMVAEVLWLAPRLLRGGLHPGSNPQARRALNLLAALAATGIFLAPILRLALHLAFGFFFAHGFRWVKPPDPLAPIELFIVGLGGVSNGPVSGYHRIGYAFILMTALAAWGAICGWRSTKGAVMFALLWTWVPPLLLQILSYLVSPFFLLEYALSSFVPFLILAALGMRELGAWPAYAALALSLVLGVAPIQASRARREPTQWREATELAAANLRPGEIAMVDPDWTVDVVLYYLRNDKRTWVESAPLRLSELQAPFPSVLIITDYGAEHDLVGMKLLSLAPDLLRKFAGVSVFRLSPQRVAQLRQG